MTPASAGLLTGFATAEGTRRFAERAISRAVVPRDHFRVFEGVHFSSLGMGTYLGKADAATDRAVTSAVIRSVVSGVVNVVDTAINYRSSHGETAVGAALSRLPTEHHVLRDEVFVATKNGYVADPRQLREMVSTGLVSPGEIASGCNCMSVPYLKDQLERSRVHLGLETIDLLYLHNVSDEHLPRLGQEEFLRALEPAFGFLEDSRKAGKIRYYGLATWDSLRLPPASPDLLSIESVVDLARTVGGKDHGFRFIQFPFNLAMPEAAALANQSVRGERVPLLEAAHRLGLGTFSSVPLLQGRLVPKLALDFARSAPGHLAPLVGHKTDPHVEENLALGARPSLSRDAFAALLEKALHP